MELELSSPYGGDNELETSFIRIVSGPTEPPMAKVIAAPTTAAMATIVSSLVRLRLARTKMAEAFTGLTPCRGRRLIVQG
jgi:hypothetical protein